MDYSEVSWKGVIATSGELQTLLELQDFWKSACSVISSHTCVWVWQLLHSLVCADLTALQNRAHWRKGEAWCLKERRLLSVEGHLLKKIINPEVRSPVEEGVGNWRNENKSWGVMVPSRSGTRCWGEVRTAGHTLLQGSWVHLVRDSSHGHDPPQGDYSASGGLS